MSSELLSGVNRNLSLFPRTLGQLTTGLFESFFRPSEFAERATADYRKKETELEIELSSFEGRVMAYDMYLDLAAADFLETQDRFLKQFGPAEVAIRRCPNLAFILDDIGLYGTRDDGDVARRLQRPESKGGISPVLDTTNSVRVGPEALEALTVMMKGRIEEDSRVFEDWLAS